MWELVPKMLCNLVMKAVTRSIHTNLARARILKGARENASVILQELPTAELPMLREQYSVHWKPCTLPGLAFPVGIPTLFEGIHCKCSGVRSEPCSEA